MSFVKKCTIFFIFISVICASSFVLAQTSESDQQKRIDELKQKLTNIGNQKKTLSSQIQQMDTQISLTTIQIQSSEKKIIETQNEIEKLGSRIDNLDSSLNTLSKLLLKQVVRGYKTQSVSLVEILFEAHDISDLTNKIKYQHATQNNNQKLLVQVQEAKASYEEQKVVREQKKQELDQLVISLNAQKDALKTQQVQKERLLAETNNDESTYQTLLAQAEAQLKGFGRFVANQGGSSLLSNQTSCDDWGCYYNQRDSQWGGNSLNNTGYTLASDGCLVTSMAMVYTHFGHRNVTPQTINSNPFNFASYYPAYLNMTIVADGTTSTRVYSAIDSELSNGRPVVVGISYDGGPNPDHFLVLISGSNGDYKMNDPYTQNGHNIPFTDHYSVGSIRTINKVNM
ncbi:MAG: C39 family peptidase [Candidatus Roizmanbacteria bacterium]|nr:C39 family peptidase [Candidatus Roizmanbacteria bacterium]